MNLENYKSALAAILSYREGVRVIVTEKAQME